MTRHNILIIAAFLLLLSFRHEAQGQTMGDTGMAMEAGGALESSAAGGAAANAAGAAARIAAPAAAGAAAVVAPVKTQADPAAVPAADEDIHKMFQGSFFLSPLEIAAIQQALAGHALKGETIRQADKPIPPHRVIRISGVLYRAPQDWVVWMNNHKVTPQNLLPEILDIKVKDSSKVSLKWYDVGLNQVIDITLRPHQVYDITTGILLPGVQAR